MLSFTFQCVNPADRVVHAFTMPAAQLGEAQSLARFWATSLVEGAPQGKDWSGWKVEVLDGLGRCRSSLPMAAGDAAEPSHPMRRRA